MAKGGAKSSNGTRRLSGNRKARYARYSNVRPWEERKIKRIMRNNGVTRAVASTMVRKPGKKAGKLKERRGETP